MPRYALEDVTSVRGGRLDGFTPVTYRVEVAWRLKKFGSSSDEVLR